MKGLKEFFGNLLTGGRGVTRHDLFPRFSHDISRLISQVTFQAA